MPLRSPLRLPGRRQIPVPKILLSHFLRQIEASHVDTPNHKPVPLHLNSDIGVLSQYPWPFDLKTRQRVPPSEMEALRRTHYFKGPCCLCPLIDGGGYIEARIGIVEVSTEDRERNMPVLHGEYVAVCARQRCGYTLCLERFYPLNSLRIRTYGKRATPLPLEELTHISDIDQSFRTGDGLFQVMSNVVIRGKGKRLEQISGTSSKEKDRLVKMLSEGVPEAVFWATFAQCIHCKAVILRHGIQAYHVCHPAERNHKHFSPYHPPRRNRGTSMALRVRLERSIGDSPEIGETRSLRSSPAPTEIVPDSEQEDSEQRDSEQGDSEQRDSEQGDSGPAEDALPEDAQNVDGDDTEDDAIGSDEDWSVVPQALSDNEELPSLMSILRGEA